MCDSKKRKFELFCCGQKAFIVSQEDEDGVIALIHKNIDKMCNGGNIFGLCIREILTTEYACVTETTEKIRKSFI